MNQIVYAGITYDDADIVNASLYAELSPIAETLGYGTLEATIRSETTAILQYRKNSPVRYLRNGAAMGVYYLQSIDRVGPKRYTLTAVDAVGLLSKRQHLGGIYTGISIADLVAEICGDISAKVATTLQYVKLYGWLPIATARDNLKQALFAIGCPARLDASGVLQIAGLPRTVSGSISKIGLSADVEYGAPVTSVSVTEHQFVASDLTELETVFEGTSSGTERVTFDEPMHSLVANGFTILESNANYAVLSVGSGSLMGKPYIHTKKVLTTALSTSQDENVVSYEDATLVSVVNGNAALERAVDYHKHTNRITADVRQGTQRCGDLLNILHPYDRITVQTYLETSELTISNELRAAQTYLVGYVPPKENYGYYDTVETISANKTWTAPAGIVSPMRVVLIGGGQGGASGRPGADGPQPSKASRSEGSSNVTYYYVNTVPNEAGMGGDPGLGGAGGKIYQASVPVTAGQTFAAVIGAGGAGGASGSTSNAGALGGATTFGAYSSNSGSSSNSGYLEQTSGKIYGSPGKAGIQGGQGSGADPDNVDIVEGPEIVVDGVTYKPGTSKYWTSQLENEAGYADLDYGKRIAFATGGFGGGAAYGANGSDGADAVQAAVSSTYILSTAGNGGNGAAALPPAAQTAYGAGGTGGNGGGGGGSAGNARCTNIVRDDITTRATMTVTINEASKGGAGSAGGAGGPGCIILYYSREV